jgi:bacterioferritin-associated ferredoxin
MYVCVCNAVTESDITEAVGQGARRLRDLRDSLGVAAECGRCASCAHSCIKLALNSEFATCGRAIPEMQSLALEAP